MCPPWPSSPKKPLRRCRSCPSRVWYRSSARPSLAGGFAGSPGRFVKGLGGSTTAITPTRKHHAQATKPSPVMSSVGAVMPCREQTLDAVTPDQMTTVTVSMKLARSNRCNPCPIRPWRRLPTGQRLRPSPSNRRSIRQFRPTSEAPLRCWWPAGTDPLLSPQCGKPHSCLLYRWP